MTNNQKFDSVLVGKQWRHPNQRFGTGEMILSTHREDKYTEESKTALITWLWSTFPEAENILLRKHIPPKSQKRPKKGKLGRDFRKEGGEKETRAEELEQDRKFKEVESEE